MDINIGETLFIIVGASISISVGELVSWFLVYRNQDYKDLASRIDTTITKYNKEKESETNAKNQEKKLALFEQQIKGLNYEMTFKKMISNASVDTLITLQNVSALTFEFNIQKLFGPKMPFGPGGPQPSLFKQ